MSKSKGNAVDPKLLADQYGVDEIRYYLLRKMAITQDSEFAIADIEQSIHSELANDLGNLLHRFSTLTQKYECTDLAAPTKWGDSSQALQVAVHKMVQETEIYVQQGFMHRAVSAIWEAINRINAFVHEQEPLKQVKADRGQFLETMSAIAHGLRSVAIMLWPVMPEKMRALLQSIGHEFVVGHNYIGELQQSWNQSFTVQKIEPLFAKFDTKEKQVEEQKQAGSKTEAEKQAEKKESYISINDVVKVDMRIGEIVACEIIEGSEKAFKITG